MRDLRAFSDEVTEGCSTNGNRSIEKPPPESIPLGREDVKQSHPPPFRVLLLLRTALKAQWDEQRRQLANAHIALESSQAALRLEKAQLAARLPSDRLWTEKEAASYLGMSPRWLRTSDVPKINLPGQAKGKRAAAVRYDPEQVRAFARKHLTHTITENT